MFSKMLKVPGVLVPAVFLICRLQFENIFSKNIEGSRGLGVFMAGRRPAQKILRFYVFTFTVFLLFCVIFSLELPNVNG